MQFCSLAPSLILKTDAATLPLFLREPTASHSRTFSFLLQSGSTECVSKATATQEDGEGEIDCVQEKSLQGLKFDYFIQQKKGLGEEAKERG